MPAKLTLTVVAPDVTSFSSVMHTIGLQASSGALHGEGRCGQSTYEYTVTPGRVRKVKAAATDAVEAEA